MTDAAAEIAELRARLAEREAELAAARAELTGARLLIEQYKAELAKLRRMQFGRSSEKLDRQIAQLELMLEDLEEGEATRTAPSLDAGNAAPERRQRDQHHPVRRPLLEHLPREEIVHSPGDVCPGCGGTHFSQLGEDVTEVLEKIPARLKVIRHIRPKLSCRACEAILQAPAPDLPVEKGRPGPGLLANVVVSKYLDGLPLYRQSAILAREGIAIERATLADWVGHAAWWVAPLAGLIGAHVMAAPVIHTDDTPIKVLAPGNGQTRLGRLWTYLVDERPWCGDHAPAAFYRFSPDRKGERPREHLSGFSGVIQADAYTGYEALTRPSGLVPPGIVPPGIVHAACWAHARRHLYDQYEKTKSPIAEEALRRIGRLYEVEAAITGLSAEQRRDVRQQLAVPILDDLKPWLEAQQRRLSAKNTLGKAIGYALKRWNALALYVADGRIAIDNNPAERSLRGIAITRKNFLFLGSEAGGDRAALLYSVLETAKLNGLDPEAYLADVLDRMAKGHPINRLAELLPWNWTRRADKLAA
ncbi:IS66 family transposase [Nitrospirillum viridazoti]|uniref:IS66 family transposase n=2 Tax=Nitrospirillum TaxID=1543705 RepID=A0A248K1N9_9PROT|nr:IS66 family transposase [Nitrospirillum amazonense]ASG24338.1 IS66 family transposase [Nitrospirillum amazonense CBAmc]